MFNHKYSLMIRLVCLKYFPPEIQPLKIIIIISEEKMGEFISLEKIFKVSDTTL